MSILNNEVVLFISYSISNISKAYQRSCSLLVYVENKGRKEGIRQTRQTPCKRSSKSVPQLSLLAVARGRAGQGQSTDRISTTHNLLCHRQIGYGTFNCRHLEDKHQFFRDQKVIPNFWEGNRHLGAKIQYPFQVQIYLLIFDLFEYKYKSANVYDLLERISTNLDLKENGPGWKWAEFVEG